VPSAITQVTLASGGKLLIVGTSVVSDLSAFTPQKGWVYVYKLENELSLVCKEAVEGAIYDMDAIRMPNNHLHLAIAVNAFLRLYDLRPLENGQQMQRLCEVHQQILIYKLKHYFERGACFIMVADIMKSLTIYTLRDEFGSKQLQLFCRDPYG